LDERKPRYFNVFCELDEGTLSAFAFSNISRPDPQWSSFEKANDSTRINRIPDQGKNHYGVSLTQESFHAKKICNKGKRLDTDAACDEAQASVRAHPVPEEEPNPECASFPQDSLEISTILNQGELIKSDASHDKAHELTSIDPFPEQEGTQHYVPFDHMSTILNKDPPTETEEVLDWTVVASSRSLLKFRSKFEGQTLASVVGAADLALCLNDVGESFMHTDVSDVSKGLEKDPLLRKFGMVQHPQAPQVPKPPGLPRRVFLNAKQRHAGTGCHA